MKRIYVVLSDTNTKVSKMLKFFSKDKYNHVSIAVSEDCSEMYSFSRWITWFPLIGGFMKEEVDAGVLAMHPETKCIIYEIEVKDDEFDVVMKRLEKFLNEPKKYRYSLMTIPLIMLNIPYERKTAYTCSSFVTYMLKGIVQMNKNMWLVKPADYQCLNLNTVYEGELREFVYSKKIAYN